jgi:hypothetical protein
LGEGLPVASPRALDQTGFIPAMGFGFGRR